MFPSWCLAVGIRQIMSITSSSSYIFFIYRLFLMRLPGQCFHAESLLVWSMFSLAKKVLAFEAGFSIISYRLQSLNKTPSWSCCCSHRPLWKQLQEEYVILSGEMVEIGRPVQGQPLGSWLFCRDNTACCRRSYWGCGMPRAGLRIVKGPGPSWSGRSDTWRSAARRHLLPSSWGSGLFK